MFCPMFNACEWAGLFNSLWNTQKIVSSRGVFTLIAYLPHKNSGWMDSSLSFNIKLRSRLIGKYSSREPHGGSRVSGPFPHPSTRNGFLGESRTIPGDYKYAQRDQNQRTPTSSRAPILWDLCGRIFSLRLSSKWCCQPLGGFTIGPPVSPLSWQK